MSYKTYTTEALVCGSRDNYTSDRGYLLFTRDGGMLWASARSVREERSKQRYALQDFTLVRISLVRGKTGWRIGSVVAELNSFHAAESRVVRGGVTRILRLVRQFVHGETAHPNLFDDTKTALVHLIGSSDETVEHIGDMYTLRLLHKLGYIAPKDSYQEYLDQKDWLVNTVEIPKEAHKAIQQALHVSHL